MTLDSVVAALDAHGCKPRKRGAGYTARCPAHDDANPSLSVKRGETTPYVLHCHAGCTHEAIVAALGLDVTPTDDFASRIVCAYDYPDETGRVLYQAVRLQLPKAFRQRRPDGRWGLGDTRRVLYRLPAVVEAAQAGRAIFLVEGEKDVDALAALGLAATSNPMGAGKWREEYVESLRGVAAAIVVADCDAPGREHAAGVCASLHAAGIPARLLDLAPDRDDGYDVADFVIGMGDDARRQLERLAGKAPRWPVAPKASLPGKSWEDFRAGVGPYDASRDYLGALLRGGQRAHVIGPIGHGKTTFLAEALSAAINGRDFLGFQGAGGGIRGIYIDLEMPPELLFETLDAARINGESKHLTVVNLPDGLEVDRNEKHREMIEGAMGEHQVVVIDPWYKLVAEELADGMRNVRTVLSFLDGLRERYERTSVVIGFHANEPQRGQKLRSIGDASGYKAFQRPCDTAVLFERLRGDRSRVTWAKTRSSRLPKMGTQWLVEWTRGEGFRRVERISATDELYAAMGDEWMDMYSIADRLGVSRSRAAHIVSDAVAEGGLESRPVGTRGGKEWHRVDDRQERLVA